MLLTKLGHSCVRIEQAGMTLIIDPGCFTSPGHLHGSDAVLVTHDHLDHFSEADIREAMDATPGLTVWAAAQAAAALVDLGPRVRTVQHGDQFTAAGMRVRAMGTWHATVHDDVPPGENTGFLVEDAVFHPGDALTVPGRPVDTLLVPVHGAWTHLDRTIDWVRRLAPRQLVGIHDAGLSDVGRAAVDGYLGLNGPGTGATYVPLDAFRPIQVLTDEPAAVTITGQAP